jgi:hypothetical protein
MCRNPEWGVQSSGAAAGGLRVYLILNAFW